MANKILNMHRSCVLNSRNVGLFFLLVVSMHPGVNLSAAQEEELDLEYGEEINETCAGCHGIYGQGSLDGEYPRLAGLEAEYIAKQLSDFKLRKRINIPMIPYANDRELPGDDVRVISEYLSSIQLPTKLAPIDEENFDALERLHASKRVVNIKDFPGDVELGKKVYKDGCASCHGRKGFGKKKKKAPQLAGQYSEYIWRQIRNFRSGDRLHDDEKEDAELFIEMSDAEVNDMLAFLATMDDEL